MDQALDSGVAWEALHGPHAIPKRYIPPFESTKGNEDQRRGQEDIDRLYELEYEQQDPQIAQDMAKNEERQAEERFIVGNAQSLNDGSGHINEMKFIKVKIQNLRIENEEILHQLIDQTFTILVEVPLPDIYQKKISTQ